MQREFGPLYRISKWQPFLVSKKKKRAHLQYLQFFQLVVKLFPWTSQAIRSGLTGPLGHLGAAPENWNYYNLEQIVSPVFTLSCIEPRVVWYFEKQLLSFHSQCGPSFTNCQWKGSRWKEEFQEYNITVASWNRGKETKQSIVDKLPDVYC